MMWKAGQPTLPLNQCGCRLSLRRYHSLPMSIQQLSEGLVVACSVAADAFAQVRKSTVEPARRTSYCASRNNRSQGSVASVAGHFVGLSPSHATNSLRLVALSLITTNEGRGGAAGKLRKGTRARDEQSLLCQAKSHSETR
jgi:hypothetical protein